MPHGGSAMADFLGVNLLGPALEGPMKIFMNKIPKYMEQVTKKQKTIWGKIGKVIPVKPMKEMTKWMKKADPYIKTFSKSIKAVTTMGLDTVGIFLQFADAIGILEPIMQILTGVLQIIGGAAMEAIGPALADFADILFSDEMMEIWSMLGEVIGDFVATILGLLADLFSDPEFQKVMKVFIEIFANVFAVIMDIFGDIITWLGTMSAAEMGALFFALGVGIAFLMGVLHGGPLAPYLASLYAGLAAAALMPLLSMQHGGYIGASQGGTHVIVAEGGEGEFIVPESKMAGGMNNEELLYATEDNGIKLDRLIGAIETSNKIARLKML